MKNNVSLKDSIKMSGSSYIDYIEHISNNVKFYMSISFIPMGFVLNLFSIYVFTSRKLRNNKISYLSCWYISFETISIIFGFVLFVFLPTVNFNISLKSEFNCKVFTYIRRIIIHCSSWTQVTCTLDRFLSIKFLNKIDILKQKGRNLCVITLIIILSISIINISNLFYHFIYTGQNNETKITCNANSNIKFTSDLISVVLRNILPFLVMLILNIIMAKDLIQSKSKFEQKNGNKRELQFTFTIICMNLIFFILNTPLSVVFIIQNIYKLNPSTSAVKLANIQLAYDVTLCVSFINNCLPFFINFAFNKLFKSEAILIIERLFFTLRPLRQLLYLPAEFSDAKVFGFLKKNKDFQANSSETQI